MNQINKANEFERFMRASAPGTQCVYHVGFLMKDREFNRRDNEVFRVGNRARTLQWLGLVHLIQRKLEEDVYQYIAVRSSLSALKSAAAVKVAAE